MCASWDLHVPPCRVTELEGGWNKNREEDFILLKICHWFQFFLNETGGKSSPTKAKQWQSEGRCVFHWKPNLIDWTANDGRWSLLPLCLGCLCCQDSNPWAAGVEGWHPLPMGRRRRKRPSWAWPYRNPWLAICPVFFVCVCLENGQKWATECNSSWDVFVWGRL